MFRQSANANRHVELSGPSNCSVPHELGHVCHLPVVVVSPIGIARVKNVKMALLAQY